jgi:hypothetical protein
VRELIAAEALLAFGFLVLLLICGVFYIVGAIGQRTLRGLEAGARVMFHWYAEATEGWRRSSSH